MLDLESDVGHFEVTSWSCFLMEGVCTWCQVQFFRLTSFGCPAFYSLTFCLVAFEDLDLRSCDFFSTKVNFTESNRFFSWCLLVDNITRYRFISSEILWTNLDFLSWFVISFWRFYFPNSIVVSQQLSYARITISIRCQLSNYCPSTVTNHFKFSTLKIFTRLIYLMDLNREYISFGYTTSNLIGTSASWLFSKTTIIIHLGYVRNFFTIN